MAYLRLHGSSELVSVLSWLGYMPLLARGKRGKLAVLPSPSGEAFGVGLRSFLSQQAEIDAFVFPST